MQPKLPAEFQLREPFYPRHPARPPARRYNRNVPFSNFFSHPPLVSLNISSGVGCVGSTDRGFSFSPNFAKVRAIDRTIPAQPMERP